MGSPGNSARPRSGGGMAVPVHWAPLRARAVRYRGIDRIYRWVVHVGKCGPRCLQSTASTGSDRQGTTNGPRNSRGVLPVFSAQLGLLLPPRGTAVGERRASPGVPALSPADLSFSAGDRLGKTPDQRTRGPPSSGSAQRFVPAVRSGHRGEPLTTQRLVGLLNTRGHSRCALRSQPIASAIALHGFEQLIEINRFQQIVDGTQCSRLLGNGTIRG